MPGKRVLVAAIVAYLLAWPLPSIVVGTEVIRGWEATRWALSPIWPDGRSIDVGLLHRLLIVASGLSNLPFIAAAFVALRWPERVTRWLVVTAWVAVLVNTHWFLPGLLANPRHWRDLGDLRTGYWLWLTAFVLLAVALGQIHRARPMGFPQKPAA